MIKDYYVSIIIPLYNKNQTIQGTILSIINQNYENYELIIIDAYSNDGSWEIVVELAKQYSQIKLYRQINQGYSVSKNSGVLLSKFDLICFIDADDQWNVNYLSENIFLVNKYPNAVAYTVGYKVVFNKYTISTIVKEIEEEGFIENYFEERINGWAPHTSSTMFYKSFFMKVGGFPSLIGSIMSNCSWLIDIDGNIIKEFNGIIPKGKTEKFDYQLIKCQNILQNVKDLNIELPGPLSEDQYLYDNLAFCGNFVFSKKILSTYFKNVDGQTTERIKLRKVTLINPHMISLTERIIQNNLNNYNKVKIKKYLKSMCVGLYTMLLDEKKELIKKLIDYHKLLLIWDTNFYFIFVLKIYIWRFHRKFRYIFSIK